MRAVVLRAPGRRRRRRRCRIRRSSSPATRSSRCAATAICGADLFPFHGLTPGFEDGHGARPRVRRRGRRGRGRTCARVRVGQRVVNTSMISDGTCALVPRGPRHAVRGPLAVRLLGRLPAARRRPGRARARAAGRPLRCARCRTRSRDEAAVFLADILPTGYGAVVRGGVAAGDTVVVRRLRAGRADGGALRGRRRRARDRRRRRRRRGASSPSGSGPRPSSRRRAADVVAEATGGLGADVVIEAAGSPGGARRVAAARARSRRDLGRRRALRARLSARQRAHVRAGADAALLDRRPDARTARCCSASWRAESSTRAPSSPTGCRSRTPPRPTACSTRARRRRSCWRREDRDRRRGAGRPARRLRRRQLREARGGAAAAREEADDEAPERRAPRLQVGGVRQRRPHATGTSRSRAATSTSASTRTSRATASC